MENLIIENEIYKFNDFEYQDYYIFKDNNIFKIILAKINDEIIIKIKKYKIIINLEKLSLIFQNNID